MDRTGRCVECGKIFQLPEHCYVEKLYCSIRCKNARNGRRRYHNNAEFRRKKNEYNRVYHKQWSKRKHEEGLCKRCGKYYTDGAMTCERCSSRVWRDGDDH